MPRHRSHSVEFNRQVAQKFLGGETLHGLAKRHDISRNLIRVRVEKYEAADDRLKAGMYRNFASSVARCPLSSLLYGIGKTLKGMSTSEPRTGGLIALEAAWSAV
jgi:hypothetical protein